jgi:hypothetical protein
MFAGVRAALAMLGFKLTAFDGARLANVGADSTKLLHELRTPAYVSGRRPANLGAVLVEPNALGRFADVPLVEASVGAMFAFLGTAYARLDARLMLLVSHSNTPPLQTEKTQAPKNTESFGGHFG